MQEIPADSSTPKPVAVEPEGQSSAIAAATKKPAPLRYVGVPPTCRLGRTPTLDGGIHVGTGVPAPVGR